MKPWDAGRYLNFSDESEDIAVAYPPETVERLRAAKSNTTPRTSSTPTTRSSAPSPPVSALGACGFPANSP